MPTDPTLERVSIDSLVLDPANVRKHDGRNLEAIESSLRRFGQQEPLIVDADGIVRAGNGRLEVMRRLGWRTVMVQRTELKGAEATAYAIASNRTAELAEWDTAALALQAAALAAEDPELGEASGYSASELEELQAAAKRLEELEEQAEEEQAAEAIALTEPAVLEPPEVPRTQRGEVWRVGGHYVSCGDSLDARDVTLEKALQFAGQHHGRERVDAVITDPPYAIYGSSTGVSSEVTDDKITRPFFRAVATRAVGVVKGFAHVYVCCDWRTWPAMADGFKGSGLLPKNLLVWYKGGGGLGANYANTYELIGFFARIDEQVIMTKTTKRGQRAVHKPNLFNIPRASGDERPHNASKPLALIDELLSGATDPGDVVLDFFGGGGSTAVACARADRWSVLSDIEPGWCDVILARLEAETGHEREYMGAFAEGARAE